MAAAGKASEPVSDVGVASRPRGREALTGTGQLATPGAAPIPVVDPRFDRLGEAQAPRPLSGRTALVTGATAGIGRATALLLAAQGADVLVHGRDRARGEAVVRAIATFGRQGRFLRADLTNFQQLRLLAREAHGVDILVNNAGAYVLGSTVDIDEKAFDAQVDINLKAPFFLVKELAPHMAVRGFGSIVNVSTFGATTAGRGRGIYGASKAGLELLTLIWADEFGPLGLRVNAVAAGPTRGSGPTVCDDGRESLGRGTALGRMAEAEEIASAIAFVSGPQASYINGAVIQAHGGIRAVAG